MDVWIYTFAIAAFLCWSASMFVTWRYKLSRINLLVSLGMIKTEKRKRRKWNDGLKDAVFRWSKQLAPLGKRFRFLINEKDLERKIALAGHPNGLDTDSFYGFRFLCMFSGLLAGTLLSWLGLGGGMMQMMLFLAGLFLPTIWIRSAALARQEQIGVELPEFMDIMSVTLQAGVPMDPAMRQILRHMDGPLSEELTRFFAGDRNRRSPGKSLSKAHEPQPVQGIGNADPVAGPGQQTGRADREYV
jgi:tight adherence protein C